MNPPRPRHGRAADGFAPATPVPERRERVHWFAGRVHEVLDEVTDGGVAVLGLSARESAETVVELLRASSRLEGPALAVLAQDGPVGRALTHVRMTG